MLGELGPRYGSNRRVLVRLACEASDSPWEVDEDCCGRLNVAGCATGQSERLIDPGTHGGELVDVIAVVAPPHVPRVHVRQRDAHHAWTHRPQHQRWPAWAHRPGVEDAVGNVVVVPVEIAVPGTYQLANDR